MLGKPSRLPEELRQVLYRYFTEALEKRSFALDGYVEETPSQPLVPGTYASTAFFVKREERRPFIIINSMEYRLEELYCRVNFIYDLEEKGGLHERTGYANIQSGNLVWRRNDEGKWLISRREESFGVLLGASKDPNAILVTPGESGNPQGGTSLPPRGGEQKGEWVPFPNEEGNMRVLDNQ